MACSVTSSVELQVLLPMAPAVQMGRVVGAPAYLQLSVLAVEPVCPRFALVEEAQEALHSAVVAAAALLLQPEVEVRPAHDQLRVEGPEGLQDPVVVVAALLRQSKGP